MRSGLFLAMMLASSLAAAETPVTIEQLLAQGWEIAGYASLSHSAMTAMKVIGDSLKQWKDGSNAPADHGRRSAN